MTKTNNELTGSLIVPITDKQIAEWRELRDEGMVSTIGEYTPPEFWDALDEIERLRAELKRISDKA
jgi:hypothetical protein